MSWIPNFVPFFSLNNLFLNHFYANYKWSIILHIKYLNDNIVCNNVCNMKSEFHKYYLTIFWILISSWTNIYHSTLVRLFSRLRFITKFVITDQYFKLNQLNQVTRNTKRTDYKLIVFLFVVFDAIFLNSTKIIEMLDIFMFERY